MNKTELQQVRDALKFAYNDCESDFVRDQKIDPAINLLDADLARVVEPVLWWRTGADTVMHNIRFSNPNGGPWTALYATPQEAAAPEWVPIATAPKDGTRYLAYAPDYGQFVENHPTGHYAGDWVFNESRNQWRGHAHSDCREATHWMLLPPAPKATP